MGKRRSRVVRRSATRKSPAVSLVSIDPQPSMGSVPVARGPAGDVDAAELIAAATMSLLAGIAEARSPLAAELVMCGALGAVETGLPDDADELERLDALTLMLGLVIDHAETLATVDALALRGSVRSWGPRQAAAQRATAPVG
jgi:hypothetical protein